MINNSKIPSEEKYGIFWQKFLSLLRISIKVAKYERVQKTN